MKTEIKYFFIGMIGMNLCWAVNYMLPNSQGILMLKEEMNVFWIMAYICFMPLPFIRLYEIYKKRKENSK